MAKKPTYSPVTDREANANEINSALDAVNEGFSNTLSLDGSTPNAMNADLDMNSNDILNTKEIDVETFKVNGVVITPDVAALDAPAVKTAYESNTDTNAFTDADEAKLDQVMVQFDTVAALLADTGTYSVGSYVHVKDGDFTYKVVASSGDGTIANSATTPVNFQVLSDSNDVVSFGAWGADNTGVTSVQTELQAAMNYAHDSNKNLFIPAGVYLVTGLTIPGTVTGADERGKSFRIYGQGYGEPFVTNNSGGTVIVSTTDSPVFADILDTDPSSNGTFVMDNIRIDATSNTEPAIKLQSFYGLSKLSRMSVYQRGTGDGIFMTYSATTKLDHMYVMNKDFVTFTLGAARVGAGIRFATTHDAGLVTINKVTSRGFKDAFILGGGAGVVVTPRITNSECSVTYNGITLTDTQSALIDGCYFEGGDQGTGIIDRGDFTTVRDNMLFPGYSKGIDSLSSTIQGSVYEANSISLGAVANAVGIDVESSAAFGGNNKTVDNNTISYTLGTAGVKGVKIQGTDPRLSFQNNFFNPRGGWTGTGTTEIDDQSSGGIFGMSTVLANDGATQLPYLSRGAISLEIADTLTEADVSSNNLTLPEGSYFHMTASVATTVQQFTGSNTSGRYISIRTTNTNTTIQDTAFIALDGSVNFTGVGIITFMLEKIGANYYAYEVSRTAL